MRPELRSSQGVDQVVVLLTRVVRSQCYEQEGDLVSILVL